MTTYSQRRVRKISSKLWDCLLSDGQVLLSPIVFILCIHPSIHLLVKGLINQMRLIIWSYYLKALDSVYKNR